MLVCGRLAPLLWALWRRCDAQKRLQSGGESQLCISKLKLGREAREKLFYFCASKQSNMTTINSPDAWNFFLRENTHDWKSWVKATSSYRSRSLLTPSHAAMRRSQLRLPSASGHGATITDFLTDHSSKKGDGGGFYSMTVLLVRSQPG